MEPAAKSLGDSDSESELLFEDAQETFSSPQKQNSDCCASKSTSLSLKQCVLEDSVKTKSQRCSDTSVEGLMINSLDHLEDNVEKSEVTGTVKSEVTGMVKQSLDAVAEGGEKDESKTEEPDREESDSESSGEEFTEEMIEDMLRGEEAEKEKGDELDKEDVSEEEEDEEEEPVIDEDALTKRDAGLSKEEKEDFKERAQQLKADGNAAFKEGNYTSAIALYTEALQTCPIAYIKERSIMYSNRAAAKLHLEKHTAAIADCTKAVTLNPNYLKALLRRAELYEKTEKLDEALVDYQKVLEMDPGEHCAREACLRLPEQIKERNEKLKDEMLGKLKDLGNMVLKPFGLSTNNFKMQQDPNSGGYSVSFQQASKE